MRALEVLGSQLARVPGRNSVEQGDQPSSFDIQTLRQLAALTGGTVYDSNWDKTLSEVIAASRFSYHMEYMAPPADGKYHKIRVTSTRKGVRIQTKQEYYSAP